MADVNAEIGVNINTSGALAQLKLLQREIARFHTSVARSSDAAALAQRDLQKNFINGINAIGGFSAELRTVKTTAENFTDSLERNKFSMREYFRYAGASTRTFGRSFTAEFDTINKVAVENVKRLQTQYIKMGRDANGAMRAIAVMPTQLDMSNLTTQTQLAAQRQAIFNQLVKQGSTNLLNFGKNTQWAGRQLMVGFTIPLIGLGTAAVRTFMDMETATIKFRKVYGDLFTPTEETQRALGSIQEIGKQFTKFGIQVADTVSLAAEAAAAGFQGIDLERQVTEATRLQVLGQIDQQKSLETTISLQNAFRMSSEDLAESINFLNAVENQTVVSLDDITTAIPKAAPIVRELGGDVKDLAFFMAAMKEGGINASEGANALKSGLASLINPTDKAKGMLSEMGIDIDRIVESNVGNLKATVIEFAKALDGLSNLQRQRAIEQLFGKFQQARLSALFDNVIRDGNQASRVLDLANASAADLAATAEKELGITADSAMNKFRSSVEQLKLSLVPIGEAVLQVVTPILDRLNGLLQWFNGLSDSTKKVITKIVLYLGGLAPVILMTVGLMANFIANGIKGLMLLRNGFLRLTGQSKVLGEQTQYLTVEQQNAVAAAASLEQSHMKLQQAFTGEAGAVRQLIAEYQRMIAAQNTAATRFPGMMQPGFRAKKYAKGVVSVPGPKGAGDIIPAMLSPGEAVIPAKMTQKYSGLIDGMISDSIPGFRRGLPDAPGSGASGRIGKSGVTIPIPYGQNVSATGGVIDFLNIDPNDFVNMSSIYTKEIAKTAQVSISEIDREINKWKMANISAIRQATDLVNQGVSAETAFTPVIEKFNKDMTDFGGATSKFVQTARVKMPELQQDLIFAQQKAKELGLNVKNAADATRLMSELPNNIVAREMATPGAFSSLRKARQASASMLGGASGISKYGIPRFMISSQAPTSSPAYLLGSSQEHFSTTARQQQNLEEQRKLREQARKNVDVAIQETKIAAQVASPSRRTIPIGEDIARGLQIGMLNQIDETKRVAQQLSSAASGLINPNTGKPFTQQELTNLRRMTKTEVTQIASKFGPAAPIGTNFLPIVAPEPKEETETKRRLGGMGGMGGSMAMLGGSMALGMAPDFTGKGMLQGGLMGGMLGMMAGPKGAGIGAAIGVAIAGMSALIAKQKEHAAVVKATFTASSEMVGLFGQKVLDTSLKITTFAEDIKKTTSVFGILNPEVQKLVDQINKLPEDNPIQLLVQNIAKEDMSQLSVAGNLLTQVTDAISTGGLDPKNAEMYVKAILAAANRTKDFAAVWAIVQNRVGDATTATTTNLNKLNNAVNKNNEAWGYNVQGVGLVGKGYNDLSNTQKILADQMLRLFAITGNGSLKFNDLNARIKGISSSSVDARVGVIALSAAINNSGNADAIKRLNDIKTMYAAAGKEALLSASNILKFNAIMQVSSKEAVMSWAEDQGFRRITPEKMLSVYTQYYKSKEFKDLLNQVNLLTNPEQPGPGANTGGTSKDKLLNLFDAELEAIRKKRDALKDVNDELDRQNQYQMKQMDLINQASRAKISGNFLEAAQLQQQSMFEGAKFTRESMDVQLGRVQSIAESARSRVQKTGKPGKGDKGLLKKLKAGNYQNIVPMPTTPTVGFNQGAMGFSGGSTTIGDTTYSIVINTTGGNAEEIRKVIASYIETTGAKQNKSNKVKK